MSTTDPATEVDPFDDLVNSLGDEPEEATEDGEAEPEETTDEEEPEPETEPEEESEEIDFDGKKLAIPKGTPPTLVAGVKQLAHDLKADYTRKTQGAAEAARSVEQRAQALARQEQLLAANFNSAVQLKATQDKLSQFEQLDWQRLADEDPQSATKLNLQYQTLQREAQKHLQQLQQGEAQRQQMTQAQQAKALQDAEEALKRDIPKWNADIKRAISESTKAYGYSDEELAQVTDPRLVKVLHDAMQWQQLQKAKPKAMQKVADAPRVAKPNAPTQRHGDKAALDRLKKTGRVEDLARLL